MAVTVTTSTQASGQVRAEYLVTLADLRQIIVGPVSFQNALDAQERASEIELRVIEQIAESDASAVVSAGGQLTTNRQRKACLKEGMHADQAYVAYTLMNRVMPDLLALNRTNAQLAALLGVSVEVVQQIKARWQYLSDNAATITAYRTVQQGLN